MDVRRLVVSEDCKSNVILVGSFNEVKKYILNKFDALTGWMHNPSEMFNLTKKEIKKEFKEFKEFQKDIKKGVRSSKNFDELEPVLYELSNFISWWELKVEEEEEGGNV